MIDTEIIDMLGNLGRNAKPRLSPSTQISGESAGDRRAALLQTIRATVLPRRMEITAGDGNHLVIEVSSSRVTGVLDASVGDLPDFDADARGGVTDKVAQLLTAVSAAPGPLNLISLYPDKTPDADDVGITMSEIEKACANLAPVVQKATGEMTPAEDPKSERNTAEPVDEASLAEQFFEGSGRFALGQLLIGSGDQAMSFAAGACAQGRPMCPDDEKLKRFSDDLSAWDADSSSVISDPQLIVLRPAGGKGNAIAILRDGVSTAVSVHEGRKLGSVVNLWKSLLRDRG